MEIVEGLMAEGQLPAQEQTLDKAFEPELPQETKGAKKR